MNPDDEGLEYISPKLFDENASSEKYENIRDYFKKEYLKRQCEGGSFFTSFDEAKSYFDEAEADANSQASCVHPAFGLDSLDEDHNTYFVVAEESYVCVLGCGARLYFGGMTPLESDNEGVYIL